VRDGPRAVKRSELGSLADLLLEVFEFYRERYSREQLRRQLSSGGGMSNTRVIVEDGKVVSHIRAVYSTMSIFGCRMKVASIGGVGTHPDYRGRGHASAMLDDALSRMRDRGVRLLIVSGDRGLYRRAGCRHVGNLLEAKLSPQGHATFSPGVTARRATPDDWPLLAHMYQCEPVRFLRSRDEFAHLAASTGDSYGEIWVVADETGVVAYVCLGPTWSRPAEPRRLVEEYAGSRTAILRALPLLLEDLGLTEVSLPFARCDREMLHLITTRGIPVIPRLLDGTYRMIDMVGLLRDLKPYLASRLSWSEARQLVCTMQDGAYELSVGEQRMSVTPAEAVELVLGSPEGRPIPAGIANLASCVFPLPMVPTGLNAV